MVCFLFNLGSSLPLTETRMYEEFTRHTLLRALTRKRKDELTESEDELELLESADELPDVESKIFHQICKLAYKKTVSSKQVMRKSEVRDFFTGNKSLGLITIDCMASMCGFDNLYTFLHLTFQEYLAAYHISKLKEDEQLKVIREYGKSKSMYVVWKFFCCLVKFQEGNAHKFESLLEYKSKLLKGDMFSVCCAFESQQPSVCDMVIKSGESGTLSFEGVSALSDCSAIDYVITNSSFPIKCLKFENCNSGAVKVLTKLQFPNLHELFLLNLHGRTPIYGCLKQCPNLHLLCLDIKDDNCRKALACIRYCPNLQTLVVHHCIGVEGAKALCNALMYCPNLQTLSLSGRNSIGDDGAKALADCLKHCPGLQNLDLQSNEIGGCGAKALAGGLKNCPNLQSLIFVANKIGADGAKALADDLHCPNLKMLQLGSNKIGDDGVKALADGLKHFPDLLALILYSNRIGDDGAKALADGLKHCPKLETLNLSSNRIGDDGAIAIKDNLKHCHVHILEIGNQKKK